MVAWFGVGKGATFLATDGTETDKVVFGIVDTESEGGEEEEGAAIEVCKEAAAVAVAVFPEGVERSAKARDVEGITNKDDLTVHDKFCSADAKDRKCSFVAKGDGTAGAWSHCKKKKRYKVLLPILLAYIDL